MSGLSEALKRLLNSDQTLTASAFTANQRKLLEQFTLSTRMIEISKQGRGTVYRVLNRPGVLAFLRTRHPLENDALPADLHSRSRNIGTDRNSKKGPSGHGCCYLLMKAWNAETVWHNGNDVLYPSEQTARFGVAALAIGPDQAWQCNRPLLLVENQALFDRCDWLPADFNGCLIYYAGQLSEVLLNWFSEHKRADEVILFPDYDGIGLSNYARLADALPPGSTLRFYWLPDWETKLATFGNPDIWRKTRILFENALKKLDTMNKLNADFIKLGQLSQHHGKALEQESIWL